MIEISCDWHDAENGVNTEQLIDEVEVRPVLYDQCLHRSFSGMEVLRIWSEVSRSIQADRNDCLKTWKKLVKTFKYLYHTSNVLLEQWTYYDQLQFLLPYAKNSELVDYDDPTSNNMHLDVMDTAADVYDDGNDDSNAVDDDDDNDDANAGHAFDTDDVDTDTEIIVPDTVAVLKRNTKQLSIAHIADATDTTSSGVNIHLEAEALAEEEDDGVDEDSLGHQYDDDDEEASPSNGVQQPPPPAAVMLKYDFVMDNEELFLLSFAPNLMRLTAKQNALARMRILEELYKLEFE